MWNKNREVILWVLVLVFGGLSIYNLTSKSDAKEIKEKKIGYVNTQEVFNDFELKKELEIKLKRELDYKQSFLDSLAYDIQLMQTRLNAVVEPSQEDVKIFQKQKALYFEHKQEIETNSAEKTREFDAQIINQMNSYIAEFGKEKGYEYVLGNNSSGFILYGKQVNEITKEVIAFINNKYQGK